MNRLDNPRIFPDSPERVDVVHTHLSVVCLAGDLVYKLKKPIQLPFVDFRSAVVRRQTCEDEVRLNRRLCPDVYLGVVALRERDGELRFDPVGHAESRDDPPPIEHAVVMRRLPEDRMLDGLLRSGAPIDPAAMDSIAAQIAALHRESKIYPAVGQPGCPTRLHQHALDNFTESEPLRGELFDPDLWDRLRERARADLPRIAPILQARLREGHVVDGHGDLHARNICLTDPPTLFDCVEFSADLRCGDTAVENSFLAMDLRYRGRRDLADRYLAVHASLTGDVQQAEVIGPLMQYRAMVRAKVGALASLDPGLSAADREGARGSARHHLQLAAAIAIEDHGPGLIAACGLPGSGKTFVFEQLAARAGWEHVSSDRLRKQTNHSNSPAARYTESAVTAIYDRILELSVERASDGSRPVLVDATFRNAADRDRLHRLAQGAGLWTRFVWFDVPEPVALARIERRAGNTDSDADARVYRQLAANFEPPASGRPGGRNTVTALRVRAERPADRLVDEILVDLLRGVESA